MNFTVTKKSDENNDNSINVDNSSNETGRTDIANNNRDAMIQEDATIENDSTIEACNDLREHLMLEKTKEACASFDLENSNFFDDSVPDDPESDGCDEISDEEK